MHKLVFFFCRVTPCHVVVPCRIWVKIWVGVGVNITITITITIRVRVRVRVRVSLVLSCRRIIFADGTIMRILKHN